MLLAAVLIGLVNGYFSGYVILRKTALFTGALSHSLLPGTAVGIILFGVSAFSAFVGALGVSVVIGLCAIGLCFRLAERVWDLEAWYQNANAKQSDWDIVLPSWVIGMVACVGLVVASVVGTYLYYPAPDSLLKDLSPINANR